MADGTVGVRQAPDADRLIDNETLDVGGQTVYRQRVALGTLGGAATEATLASVLAAVDTLEALVTTLRDTVYRRTDPLPESTNQIGYVSSSLARKIAVEGKGQVIGGEITTSLANPNAWLSIENPAGSTVNVVVFGVTLYTDAATATIRYARNYTGNTNALAADPIYFNTAAWGAPLQAVVRFGRETPTGHTVLSPVSRFNSTVPFALREIPIILTPGNSFVLQVTGTASGSLVLGNVYWWEDPV